MKTSRAIILTVLAIFCLALLTGIAMAEEKVSIKGKVKSINVDAKTAVVATEDGKDVTITVEDEETLNKFKDGRISTDDDVKVKYVIKDGKNVATYFKKAAGC
ncbi:MAG: hypothetical protein QMD44_00710 [Thermodesulfovibrionales bacterium]|jgi:maltose-binding protein MalE|nr:hypothetical protein [Thermodesulfovibrionales bacterium]